MSVFGGALQPNPQQGTHPTLVWVITLRWFRSAAAYIPSRASTSAVLPFVFAGTHFTYPQRDGRLSQPPARFWVGIEPRTCCMTVCCSTNWAIPASNYTLLHTATTLSMDFADYWLMAREYSIWNTAIASLQFWTADLDPVNLGRATERVYITFFYSPSSHTLHQQSDKILFGHFVIALNAAFDQQLSLAD